MSGGVQLSIGDLLYAMKKRIKLIVTLTIAGLIVGIVLSLVTYLQGTMSRNYEVNASVVVTTETANGLFSGGKSPDRNDFLMAKEMTDTVRYILKSESVMKKVIDNLGLVGVSARSISRNLTLNQWNESPVIELSLTWQSSEEGIAIMSKILEVGTKSLQDTLKAGTIKVLSQPSARYIVGGSVGAPMWGLIAMIGLMCGIGIAVLDVLVRPTLINLKDVQTEFGMETIGIIPYDPKHFKDTDKTPLELMSDEAVINQDYSAAAYILKNRIGNGTNHHRIYVTSAADGEGKTTIAANIAMQLAEMEQKVLLVDFNTRNPELSSMFLKRIDYEHSLNSLYRGETNESEAITSITGYLDILPVVLEHTPIPIDGMILDLVNRLAERYDYVIMDTQPVGKVSGTLGINKISDAALFVIGYDMAQKSEIKESVELLEKSGVRILGCVINGERSIENDLLKPEQKRLKKKAGKSESKKGEPEYLNEMTQQVQTEEPIKKEKKEKKSLFKHKKKEEPIIESPSEMSSVTVMEDLLKTEETKELKDEDAVDELIRIGIDKK